MRSLAERPQLVAEGGRVIVQVDPKEYESLDLAHLREANQRKYGNTILLFFEPAR